MRDFFNLFFNRNIIALGSPGGSVLKTPPAKQEIWVQSSSWDDFPRGVPGKPTPVFLPGEFHGQRGLACYSPWGCKRVRHKWATKQHQYNTTTVASLLSNVVFISALQRCESALCACMSPPSWASLPLHPHSTALGHHRAPGCIPWAMQPLPTHCFTHGSTNVNATLSVHPIFSPPPLCLQVHSTCERSFPALRVTERRVRVLLVKG